MSSGHAFSSDVEGPRGPRDARATLTPGIDHEPMPLAAIERTLAVAIEVRARRRPEAVAVQVANDALTYRELDRAANRVAWQLHDAGITAAPGTRVAVLAHQGIELIVGIVGVLKAGAAYVPLDPVHPAERSAAVLAAVRPVGIVSEGGSLDLAIRLAGPDRPVVGMSTEAGGPDGPPPRMDDPSGAAYVYFTSGSTGVPKGVVDSHRNVLHNVRRYTNTLAIGAGDRLALVQTFTFSGAVSSLFGALVNGATTYPFDPRQAGTAAMRRWLRDERLTMFHGVPVLFRELCTGDWRYPDIRVIRLEGDAASWADVDAFRAHFERGAVLVNGLGATETGLVRQFFVDHDTPLGEGGLPVGNEVPDMDVQILGADGRPVPPGDLGEIAVRSQFLALGYWDDPARTATRFTVDPVDPGVRTYRTGDLGRIDPAGRLTIAGRADLTFKIRGETIDLPEIERRLAASDGVAGAVAVTQLASAGGPVRLIAYVVPTPGSILDPIKLRRDLARDLPPAAVPSVIAVLDAFPVDGNSKIDRTRLPVPSTRRPDMANPYIPAQTPTERLLVDDWEALLGIQPIGILDDFFDLGGDSLAASILLGTLSERVGIDLADDVVLAASTVEDLARRLEPGQANQRASGMIDWFAIHNDPGDHGFYARVARALPATTVLRTLGPPGDPGASTASVDIVSAAAAHRAAIRRVRPHGPYHLAGFCFAAVIALELAHQLQADGEEIASLVMLSISPTEFPTLASPTSASRYRAWQRRHRTRLLLARIRRAGPRRAVPVALDRGRILADRLVFRLRARLAHIGGMTATPRSVTAPDQVAANTDALRRYRAAPFDGRVVIVLGRAAARHYSDEPATDWGRLARDVEVVLLPGGEHEMLLDPVARDLAAELVEVARETDHQPSRPVGQGSREVAL